MPAHLTYYINEGVLVALIGGRTLHLEALSGGGGGSRTNPTVHSANNPYMTGLKTTGAKATHVHGGPIPVGTYTVSVPENHPHLGRASRLTPASRQPMHGRGGFFIHGRGSHGSDGCIVPLNAAQFSLLMNALQNSGGGSLVVQEAMSGGRFA
jgi:hypothetical protein